jgi:hypothetical protein
MDQPTALFTPDKNGTKELIAFFSTPERPVTAAEFMGFWKSCTDEQKDYYRNAKI